MQKHFAICKKKNVTFNFDEACQEGFNRLKEKLISAPIFASLGWLLLFELMCDATDFAIGAILGQCINKDLHTIYYATKTMNESQANYATTVKELLAIVSAMDKLRSYLMGARVVVLIDYSVLKHLWQNKEAKLRLIRWVLLLQEFDLK